MCRVPLELCVISPFYYLVNSSTKCLNCKCCPLTFQFSCWSYAVSLLRRGQHLSSFWCSQFHSFIVTCFQSNVPSGCCRSAFPGNLMLSFHTQVFCIASACESTCHPIAPCIAYRRWALVIRLVRSQHAARFCNLSICYTTSLRIGFKVSLVDCVQRADAPLYRIQISHL